jgi:hypothetical protein
VTQIKQHKWGTKEVDSAYFFQPDSENVSAVIFNPAGTLTKFNRIGVATGFGSSDVTLVQEGFRIQGEPPERAKFSTEITEGNPELWVDGMNVFHNPRAVVPLRPNLLPGAAHHRFLNGQFESMVPIDHVESSRTLSFVKRI